MYIASVTGMADPGFVLFKKNYYDHVFYVLSCKDKPNKQITASDVSTLVLRLKKKKRFILAFWALLT